MEGKDKGQDGVFVWKIANFLEFKEECKESSAFKLGKYDCFLRAKKIDDIDEKWYRVYLHDYNGESINHKSFCRLSLINGQGKEGSAAQRSILKFKKYIYMITIRHSELICEKKDLLPEGVLTLRLSWCDKEDLNSEKEPSELMQNFSEELGPLYEGRGNTDVWLKVGEVTIPVHSAVLSNCSEVFADMIRRGTSENRSSVVNIPDVDFTVFSNVLCYIYSGQIREMSADTIFAIYRVADQYALDELMDACVDIFKCSLMIEDVCSVALLAHNYGGTELEAILVQFVEENFEEIEETVEWKELLESKPYLAYKLLRSAFMIHKQKDNSSSSE